jgi:hypothetical protein
MACNEDKYTAGPSMVTYASHLKLKPPLWVTKDNIKGQTTVRTSDRATKILDVHHHTHSIQHNTQRTQYIVTWSTATRSNAVLSMVRFITFNRKLCSQNKCRSLHSPIHNNNNRVNTDIPICVTYRQPECRLTVSLDQIRHASNILSQFTHWHCLRAIVFSSE